MRVSELHVNQNIPPPSASSARAVPRGPQWPIWSEGKANHAPAILRFRVVSPQSVHVNAMTHLKLSIVRAKCQGHPGIVAIAAYLIVDGAASQSKQAFSWSGIIHPAKRAALKSKRLCACGMVSCKCNGQYHSPTREQIVSKIRELTAQKGMSGDPEQDPKNEVGA